jgi:hypothetical protein
MASIPTIEPQSVTAGDTIQWTRSLADYPANSGWTLNYRIINTTRKYDIAGSASGSDHFISVAASVSEAWAAGDYDWQAYVSNASGDRHTIANGRIKILPNLAGVTDAGMDGRSPARQIYDGLIAAYQDAVISRAFISEYRVANRQFKFSTRQEWIIEVNFWKREVAKEEAASNIKRGLASRRRVYVRF